VEYSRLTKRLLGGNFCFRVLPDILVEIPILFRISSESGRRMKTKNHYFTRFEEGVLWTKNRFLGAVKMTKIALV